MKNCVVTGNFQSMTRKDLLQSIVNLGGNIKSGVSFKTDLLIVGEQDVTLVGASGTSTKERKAQDLINIGKKDIAILSEDEFLKLLNTPALQP